jgi:predicted DCC family thiol-disulfide oxidoreductase YuxK
MPQGVEEEARRIRPVLLYDAGCRLCRFAARSIARLDRGHELALLPLSDPEAATFLARLPEEERLSSWRLALPDGTLAGEGVGFPDLLRVVRLTRPIGVLLEVIPARALNGLYGLVARNRSLLGPIVPDGPAPRRFP